MRNPGGGPWVNVCVTQPSQRSAVPGGPSAGGAPLRDTETVRHVPVVLMCGTEASHVPDTSPARGRAVIPTCGTKVQVAIRWAVGNPPGFTVMGSLLSR